MKASKAKELGFTHEGKQFGFVPVYICENYEGLEIRGKNKFWDFILDILVSIDVALDLGYSFECWVNEKPL